MRITTKASEEKLHLFVDHGVVHDQTLKLFLLRCVGQLAVIQQITDLEKVTMHRKLFNGVALIEQLALVTIDVGNRRLTRGG